MSLWRKRQITLKNTKFSIEYLVHRSISCRRYWALNPFSGKKKLKCSLKGSITSNNFPSSSSGSWPYINKPLKCVLLQVIPSLGNRTISMYHCIPSEWSSKFWYQIPTYEYMFYMDEAESIQLTEYTKKVYHFP